MTRTISKAQLAREMLEKAVFEWQEAPYNPKGLDFFISDINREITIGLKFETPYGPTTISFNPQSTVEEFVEKCQSRLEQTDLWADEALREMALRSQVNGSITIMLLTLCRHFEDAIGELPLVVNTLYACCSSPAKKSLIDALLTEIIKRKKARLHVRGRGRKRMVTDQAVYGAVELLGGEPSQRAVARAIGVAPRRVRDWQKSKGFDRWEDFLRAIREGRK